MTFEDRVRALEPLGLTPRQTRFVVTVALHGGYCLRRQYATFAGVPYGIVVRQFLDGLVHRGFARCLKYRPNRGLVYHLYAKSIYRLLEQDDNRNRKRTSPAVIARKLMVLDFVLSQPHVTWYATEQEKIALFTERYAVPKRDLPQRSYPASDPKQPATTRYFVHKWPVYLAGEPARVHLVALVIEPFGTVFQQFLLDHARLLSHLPAWTMVTVSPVHQPGHEHGVAACRAAFQRYVAPALPQRGEDQRNLKRYFRTRQAVESGNLGPVPIADLDHFREFRQRVQDPAIETLYARWRVAGDSIFAASSPAAGSPGAGSLGVGSAGLGADLDVSRGPRQPGFGPGAHAADAHASASPAPQGELLTHELPFTYEQFGDLAGVC